MSSFSCVTLLPSDYLEFRQRFIFLNIIQESFRGGHWPWHVLNSTEMLAVTTEWQVLLCMLSALLGPLVKLVRVLSQLTHNRLVPHPAHAPISANLWSIFHRQSLKGSVWLNKPLDLTGATSASNLGVQRQLQLALALSRMRSRKDWIQSWEISWESEPRTTGNRHTRVSRVNHYQYSWSNAASL